MCMHYVCAARYSKLTMFLFMFLIKYTVPNYRQECLCTVPCQPQLWLPLQVWSFSNGGASGRLRASAAQWGKEKRDSIWGVCQGKQQTCIDRNTRHIHPWSNAVGGEEVSGWECTGGLRTVGGRVRRVWMVLDGSKEASLPSCGDKPSLALQQRVTHSVAQWRIWGQIVFKKNQKVLFCKNIYSRGVSSPHQAV